MQALLCAGHQVELLWQTTRRDELRRLSDDQGPRQRVLDTLPQADVRTSLAAGQTHCCLLWSTQPDRIQTQIRKVFLVKNTCLNVIQKECLLLNRALVRLHRPHTKAFTLHHCAAITRSKMNETSKQLRPHKQSLMPCLKKGKQGHSKGGPKALGPTQPLHIRWRNLI